MSKKQAISVVIILVVLATLFISFPSFFFMSGSGGSVSGGNELIGGQRDEHGCLGPAGYSWDEELNVCLRSWEVTDLTDRAAVKAVNDLVGSINGLTVVAVNEGDCSNCKMVFLEKDAIRIGLLVQDGKVVDRPISPLECAQKNGVVRKPSQTSVCEPAEYLIGAIDDTTEQKYCCYAMELEEN